MIISPWTWTWDEFFETSAENVPQEAIRKARLFMPVFGDHFVFDNFGKKWTNVNSNEFCRFCPIIDFIHTRRKNVSFRNLENSLTSLYIRNVLLMKSRILFRNDDSWWNVDRGPLVWNFVVIRNTVREDSGCRDHVWSAQYLLCTIIWTDAHE